jgi:acyl-CoA synthetase (AMP-forming)/AMP-acid ligase II
VVSNLFVYRDISLNSDKEFQRGEGWNPYSLLHKEKGMALTYNISRKFQGRFGIKERKCVLLGNPTTAGNFTFRETISFYAGLLSGAVFTPINPTDSVLREHRNSLIEIVYHRNGTLELIVPERAFELVSTSRLELLLSNEFHQEIIEPGR